MSSVAESSPARRGRPPTGGREQILAAAYDLLNEKGIAKLTTKAVAERAGVSEGSIFYHFKDRAGMLSAVFEAALLPLAQFRERGAGSDELRPTLLGFTAAVEEFLQRAVVIMFAAQADTELKSELTSYLGEHDLGPQRGVRIIGEFLAKLQDGSQIRADIDPHTAAFMLLSSCMLRVSHPRLIGHSRGVPSREQVVDQLITMISK
ncbi:TetR/AcrR family transcriptional regulator [Skermania sp. ID1734]|uniref:TetR/AcrR family transcriptional regulator n=1 Tax=Skermania sp. ID1734 TaxID=2597516 RepID=UPI00163D8005|nr:TetR/AcrR family transcriptional regulator [Skermania sp. ID1734]